VADGRGWRVGDVLETHVHNDYVSGAMEVRAATGARVHVPAKGRYGFPSRPMAEGDEVEVGDVVVTAMETPGHTPEHLAYVVRGPGSAGPSAVFTGGSLMVGSAGRTDLLGPERTDELTRAQHRSLARLATLPAAVAVLPTHGAGSFCASASPGGQRSSTIGEERAGNVALRAPDEETFVAERLSGLPEYPAYYRHMAAINRRGPDLLGSLPSPAPLRPDEVERRIAGGAWIVDARWRESFAKAHVPGSVNVELDPSFGTYVGWIVPWDTPLVLVLPEAEERGGLEECVTQLRRIGCDRVDGYLAGGLDAWRSSGRPVATYPSARVSELCDAIGRGGRPDVLDVRQPLEWSDEGRIAGSRTLFVGHLTGRLGEIPSDHEVWTICRSGHRASIAASLLDRAGIPVRVVFDGGVPDLLRTCEPLEAAAGSA